MEPERLPEQVEKSRKGIGRKNGKIKKIQTIPEKIWEKNIRRTRRGQGREVKNRGAVLDLEFSSVVPKKIVAKE